MTNDYFVGKLSTMGQPTRPTQPSTPAGGIWVVIYAYTSITEMETIKTVDNGYVRLCDCKPKSVSEGLGCGLD